LSSKRKLFIGISKVCICATGLNSSAVGKAQAVLLCSVPSHCQGLSRPQAESGTDTVFLVSATFLPRKMLQCHPMLPLPRHPAVEHMLIHGSNNGDGYNRVKIACQLLSCRLQLVYLLFQSKAIGLGSYLELAHISLFIHLHQNAFQESFHAQMLLHRASIDGRKRMGV